MAASAEPRNSPTTSIQKVLLTLAISAMLGLLLDARAIVHAGAGMPDGAMRTVTLNVGQAALSFDEALHLTWPWDRLAAALGRQVPTGSSPLLASGADQTPQPTIALIVSSTSPTVSPPPVVATATRVAPAPTPTPTRTAPTHTAPTATATPSARPATPTPSPSDTATPRPTAGPTATPRPTAGPTATPAPSSRLLHLPSDRALRLLVTGDSLVDYMGPMLVGDLATLRAVDGTVDARNAAGLTRPDYLDWAQLAQRQVAAHDPDAVVVLMGANDYQNMALADGRVLLAGSPEWTEEYQRRAEACMRIWAQGGTRRVYWLAMPPARNPQWAAADRQINVAVQRAASQVPGAAYLDILGLVTDHGRYASAVVNHLGQTVPVREGDGVNLSVSGSRLVAREVLRAIEQDARRGYTVVLPLTPPTATPLPTMPPTATSLPAPTSTPPPLATHAPATATPIHASATALPTGTPVTQATATPLPVHHHKPPPPPRGPAPGLWQPTAAHPLRLLVTGDSLPGYMGPQLVNYASAAGPVVGFVDVHDGTGLTRPDFVDWSQVAQQQMAQYHPDAVVVWIGGNDFQNMTLPNGAFFQAGTRAWTQEYARRAAICMRIWARGGKTRVYWLAMPPARRSDWADDDAQINIALRSAAAQVPGTEYVDILGPILNHGQYTDYVTENGTPVLIRESDGVHLNVAGSDIVAHEVLGVLEREWNFGPTVP